MNRLLILILVIIMLPMQVFAYDEEEDIELSSIHKGINVDGVPSEAVVNLTADSAVFSITVPTVLPIHVDDYGKVYVSGKAEVENHSTSPVKIDRVIISSIGAFKLNDYDSLEDGELYPNSEKIVMYINGLKTDGVSQKSCTKVWNAILPKRDIKNPDDKSYILNVDYMVKIAVQTENINRNQPKDVMKIVFITDWAS